MTLQTDHEHYMQRCLELAQFAVAGGNVGVGAVLVQAGQIIAEASETLPSMPDIVGHAELLAVRSACLHLNTLDLSDCILYTTAEPCWMCSYAIRETNIKTVVIGTPTLDVGGLSTRYTLLSDDTITVWDKPPQIITGVLAAACAKVRG